jgi:hypothetical protein
MADFKIPGLRQQRNAWFWEPSATLAREGWNRLTLGNDKAVAIVKAQARVAEVEAWRAAGKPPLGKGGKARTPVEAMTELQAPILPGGGITLARLIREYQLAGYPRADDKYDSIRPSTQRAYDGKFAKLIAWAGHRPANRITEKLAEEFYEALIKRGCKSSANLGLAAAKRVYAWGVSQRLLARAENPFTGISAAKTSPRRQVWDNDRSGADYELFANAAEALGRPELALAIDLYLTLGQRTSDMVKVSSDDWRPILGLDPYKAGWLVSDSGPNAGEVMGFHVNTKKTGVPVTVPVGGDMRRRVEAQIERNRGRNSAPVKTLLVNEETGQPWATNTLQKWFRRAREHAVEALGLPQFAGLQLRDLRRTAVVRMAEAGVGLHRIIAITGHTEAGATKIIRTYMVLNVDMAAGAVVQMMEHQAKLAAHRADARRAGIRLAS